MYLMGFDGRMGEGKTFGMSLLAQHFRQKSGCTLYSNYGLAGSKLFTTFDQFLDVAQQPSSIICLDEIHTDLDSRSGNTNISKYFTHMIFYLRKLRCTIMFASPLISNVEYRVRGVMNVYCQVSKTKNKFRYEMWDMQSGAYLRTMTVNQQKAFAIGHQIYDTHKMVVPMEFPSTKEEYNTIINKLKDLSDQYYINGQATNAPEAELPEVVAV